MEVISDKKLLNDYITQHQIQELFSFWSQYEFSLIRFQKGEVIKNMEQSMKYILFVVKGCWKIYFISEEGKMLDFAYKENFGLLGDMEFAGETKGPYAEAVTEVYCIALSLENYGDLLNEDLKFCKCMMKSLAAKLNKASKNSFFNQAHSKENRLAAYILKAEENELVCENWTQVAGILSMSYRQLMRLLSQFCEMGLVERGPKKGCYKVIDREGLQQLTQSSAW